jgi:hypothetical protein
MRAPLFSAFLVLAGLTLAGAASVRVSDPARHPAHAMLQVESADSSGCPYLDGQRARSGQALRLPPGHPPVGGEGDGGDDDAGLQALPPGHPPVDGHAQARRLPPGHPPVDHSAAPRFDASQVVDL